MLHLGYLKVSNLYINNFKIIFQQSDFLHRKLPPLILLLESLCWIVHRGFVADPFKYYHHIYPYVSQVTLSWPPPIKMLYLCLISPNVCPMFYHSQSLWFGHPNATDEECNLRCFSVCNYLNFLSIWSLRTSFFPQPIHSLNIKCRLSSGLQEPGLFCVVTRISCCLV